MIDLRLITILPPQPVQAVSQPQIAGGGQGNVATLGNLQVGSIISGFIINRDANGNPILRTGNGDITFASNFFLKIGSEITIRVEHIAGNNSAHILSVNGETPEVAATQSGFAVEPDIVSNSVTPSTNNNTGTTNTYNDIITSNVKLGDNAKITLNSTVISPALTKDGKPVIPNQTQVTLKLLNITQPIVLQQTTPSQTTPQTILPQAQTIISPPLQEGNLPPEAIQKIQSSTSSPNAQLQEDLTATPAKILPAIPVASNDIPLTNQAPQATINNFPNKALQAGQPPQIGQQITATVINNDTNGEAIVQTSFGILRLPVGTQLTVGSQVSFEIEQIQTPENIEQAAFLPVVNVATTTPAPLTQLARNAGALSDIFVLLSGLGTRDANSFLNNNLPSVGTPNNPANTENMANASPDNKNLPSSLLSFVSALRGGDFRNWLGKGNAKWLEDNGHGDLLKKAEGEFSSLAKQFTEAPTQNWQTLFFPLAVGGQLEQVRLFVKKDRNQETNDGVRKDSEDTRFVLEMDLSQLGQMQMDGFVRRQEKSVQFDLVIRSQTPLTKEVQQNISQIYNDAGEITGYQGSINFQTVKDFPVNPMEDIMENNHAGVVA